MSIIRRASGLILAALLVAVLAGGVAAAGPGPKPNGNANLLEGSPHGAIQIR